MGKRDDVPTHFASREAWAKYYRQWEENGFFAGRPEADGASYAVVIPPPNVTGSLHMGHALNNTLQDVLVRYRRMDGDNVVWIPGTDHASIAVHWLVDKALKAEGTDRFAIGRQAFLDRAWSFKTSAGNTIGEQLRQLGASCDWARERFTMDEGLSRAVREAFVRLYEEGLIYRAETLVNWDPLTQTTLSDLEVVHEEDVPAQLWHFAYPLADGSGEIVVATTRPETMLGDTAVAVHPNDPRYTHLIGKHVTHPLLQRTFPIIADAQLVDPEFGTGAVKITPAHDFNDFAVGKRHELPMINILTPDGRINERGGAFVDMTIEAARTAVREAIVALGLDRGCVDHTMNIGRSERSGAVVEPMLSTQWFVRAKPLAAPALAAVENDFTRFVPQQWANTYFAWLRDIRDWCISRQLWWGHQIPAWYCAACPHITVSREVPAVCAGCGGSALRQDEDVLDTWFSSSLWPFSTMGWPEKTPDLAAWYPTQVLITGFDIIFFWVARMMMMGLHLMGAVPFRHVYIHALIRDPEGEKMSKTKGNVIDPLAMIDKYGVDAFRFTLVAFAAQGRDVRWDEKRAAGYHKFCNKIWQALRFVLTNLEHDDLPKAAELSVYDRWIRHRFGLAVARFRQALAAYRFNEAASTVYAFIWDELCDWYLELAKVTLYSDSATEARKDTVRRTLIDVVNGVARLLHPIMPFLSEEVWQRLPGTSGSVMQAAFPHADTLGSFAEANEEAEFIKNTITAVRRIRAELGIAPKKPLEVLVRTPPVQAAWLEEHVGVTLALAHATCGLQPDGTSVGKVATEVFADTEVSVRLSGVIDFDSEIARLDKEIGKLDKDISRCEGQLGNDDFIARAPGTVVAEKRSQLAAALAKRERLAAALSRLRGS